MTGDSDSTPSPPGLERPTVVAQAVTLRDVQRFIKEMYGAKDSARGVEGTFMWFIEEVGELSSALRAGPSDNLVLEFADVLAWLVTLANVKGVDLELALRQKYGGGCPGCQGFVCTCGPGEKP